MKCNRRFAFVVFVLLSLAFASSAQTVIVVPSNAASLGFSTADTRPGGAVSYVVDGTLPGGGVGGLNMTTDGTTAAKAQYLRADLLPLASLTDVSYWAKQNSAPLRRTRHSIFRSVWAESSARRVSVLRRSSLNRTRIMGCFHRRPPLCPACGNFGMSMPVCFGHRVAT